MSSLTFEDLKFRAEGDFLLCILYEIFECKIPLSEFKELGELKIEERALHFSKASEKKAHNTFYQVLGQYIDGLVCTVTKKPSVYVHRNLGLPLIGYIGIGIIDRGSNLIELRPMTGCNLNCNYCSVDEGLGTRKVRDFVIEEEYLFDEVRKIIPLKQCDDLEIHINTQGEPTLYARFAKLCKDLRTISAVKRISTNTNGMLLTREKIDEYVSAGLTQINLSLNAIDPKKAKIIAGSGKYDVEHAMDMMRYAVTKCDVTIAPTFIQGYNEDEMEKLVVFFRELLEIKSKGGFPFVLRMGIQNFLHYKQGRNPAEEVPWEKFYAMLTDLEKRYDVKLIVSAEDFSITDCPGLPRPMKKGDIVKAQIVCQGRYREEVLAVAHDRAICVHRCPQTSGMIKVKILRDKDSIYDAVPL